MAEHSAIEWTDATWNPTTGCTKVSPACANCYIERTPPFRIRGRGAAGCAVEASETDDVFRQ
jgi:protein gp37